jgi:Fe2+ transport protein
MARNALRRKPSEEASRFNLALASAQGAAFAAALKHMATFVADDGREVQEGEYLVAYAVEEAEGLYHFRRGKLEWHQPTKENVHVEVVIRDAADGRFIPGLKVFATLIDEKGHEIGTHEQAFLWHPWLYHYGRNWKVPRDGVYTLRIRFAAPEFHRHDRMNGRRFAKGAEVEFTNVNIKTGRK